MSKTQLVITAVILEGRTQAEVAATYGVSKSWVSKLIARYHADGEEAFQPRSRRPKTSPGALDGATVALILQLRERLTRAGLGAGPETIAWHLAHHHKRVVSSGDNTVLSSLRCGCCASSSSPGVGTPTWAD